MSEGLHVEVKKKEKIYLGSCRSGIEPELPRGVLPLHHRRGWPLVKGAIPPTELLAAGTEEYVKVGL